MIHERGLMPCDRYRLSLKQNLDEIYANSPNYAKGRGEIMAPGESPGRFARLIRISYNAQSSHKETQLSSRNGVRNYGRRYCGKI